MRFGKTIGSRRPAEAAARQGETAGAFTDEAIARMMHQVGRAIDRADGTDLEFNPRRHRNLTLGVLRPLTRPTEAMVDAATRRYWSDRVLAINSRVGRGQH